MTTFSKGDRVRFNQNYDFPIVKGDEGTVEDFFMDLLSVKLDKYHGRRCYVYPYRLDKIEAKPEFFVGQRVTPVSGYAYASHKDKPLVVLNLEYLAVGVGPVGNDASLSHSSKGWLAYNPSTLEAYKPTFEVGDYVEVWGHEAPSEDAKWEGRKGEVTIAGKAYVIVKFDDKEDSWYASGGFKPSVLRKAERPVPTTVLEKAGLKVGDKVRWTGVNNGLSETFKRNGGTVSGELYNFVTVDVEGKGKDLLYNVTELEKGEPTLLAKHGYKVGDKVRPTGVNPNMTSGKFTEFGGVIAKDQTGGDPFITVNVNNSNAGVYLPKEIELGEVESKLKVGDWVEQQGYGLGYDGVHGEVISLQSNIAGWATLKREHGSTLSFPAENLKLAQRPVPFKVGDYVEVHGRDDKWDGTKGEVTYIESPGSYYRFLTIVDADGQKLQFETKKLKKIERPAPVKKTILDAAGVKVGDKVYWSGKNTALDTGFREDGGTVVGESSGGSYIKVISADGTDLLLCPNELTLTKPKTWAEKAVNGDVFVTKYDGKVTRFITKTGEDEWTLQYPDSKALYRDYTDEQVEDYDATKV